MDQRLAKQIILACAVSFPVSFPVHADQQQPGSQDEIQARLQEARSATMDFAQGLASTMKKEMQAGGPTAAIKVCRDVAPAMASEISLAKG